MPRKPKKPEPEDGFDVYASMLADVGVKATSRRKPVKRRKTEQEQNDDRADQVEGTNRKRALRESERAEIAQRTRERMEREEEERRKRQATQATQTAVDWAGFEGSEDESEVDWEDIDIAGATSALRRGEDEDGPVNFTLGDEEERPESKKETTVSGRPKITALDRKIRLEEHKSQLQYLLEHYTTLNTWLNDDAIQNRLKPLLPTRIIEPLKAWKTEDSFTGSRLFIDGLKKAQELYARKFTITKPSPTPADSSSLSSLEKHYPHNDKAKATLLAAAKTLTGSRDTGAALFCALLRSHGIDARLVASLQPIPLKVTPHDASPSRSPSPPRLPTPPPPVNPSPRKRLGRPTFTAPTQVYVAEKTPSRNRNPSPIKNTLDRSHHPTVWVEAFSPSSNHWICVSPLTNHTPNQPHSLDPHGALGVTTTYVLGIDSAGGVRDVTRRYASHFLAKTRTLRIESTKHGSTWYTALLSPHKPPDDEKLALETKEFAELDKKEGIPTNVADFKDHPLYRLERFLRKDEILVRREKVADFSPPNLQGKRKKTEPVFPASDVVKIKTPEQWYRLGRIVREGAQPLRVLPPKKGAEEDAAEVVLFSEDQTEVYKPPPIIPGMGVVPKNAYGNLDVFVPSMVPEGGVHIRSRFAAAACKALGVDYADAVTGFKWQGKGKPVTPTVDGVVIAVEFKDQVEEQVRYLEAEQKLQEDQERSKKALARWMTWLLRLRIRERVEGYDMEEDSGWKGRGGEVGGFTGVKEDKEDGGGGFLPDADEDTGGGFIVDEHTRGGGFLQDAEDMGGGGFTVDDDEPMQGGGFTVDDDGSREGGFLPDSPPRGGGFLPDDDTGSPKPSRFTGGGFLPDDDARGPSSSTRSRFTGGGFMRDDREGSRCALSLERLSKPTGGGFLPDDADGAGSREKCLALESRPRGGVLEEHGTRSAASPASSRRAAGGFIADDEDDDEPMRERNASPSVSKGTGGDADEEDHEVSREDVVFSDARLRDGFLPEDDTRSVSSRASPERIGGGFRVGDDVPMRETASCRGLSRSTGGGFVGDGQSDEAAREDGLLPESRPRGGFLPEEDTRSSRSPSSLRRTGKGFLVDDDSPSRTTSRSAISKRILPIPTGGGFLPDDEDQEASRGGCLPPASHPRAGFLRNIHTRSAASTPATSRVDGAFILDDASRVGVYVSRPGSSRPRGGGFVDEDEEEASRGDGAVSTSRSRKGFLPEEDTRPSAFSPASPRRIAGGSVAASRRGGSSMASGGAFVDGHDSSEVSRTSGVLRDDHPRVGFFGGDDEAARPTPLLPFHATREEFLLHPAQSTERDLLDNGLVQDDTSRAGFAGGGVDEEGGRMEERVPIDGAAVTGGGGFLPEAEASVEKIDGVVKEKETREHFLPNGLRLEERESMSGDAMHDDATRVPSSGGKCGTEEDGTVQTRRGNEEVDVVSPCSRVERLVSGAVSSKEKKGLVQDEEDEESELSDPPSDLDI
ncbi:Rad4-domain-containing protein [Ascobolus immersus RN42]|uniref:Rad4-domain-containing protein n=1 Tax=Ascobolus immersus RN42 TaxID=1160509 RepID=A0A3N4HF28_ASCIM|nr:Rad4-domain-containing protein [Ascobolus immersus RN42]